MSIWIDATVRGAGGFGVARALGRCKMGGGREVGAVGTGVKPVRAGGAAAVEVVM